MADAPAIPEDTAQHETDAVSLAALAGLLLDIGVFAQRAGAERGTDAGTRHSLVREFVPERWWADLAPVIEGRQPQERLSRLVALADRLSAGERTREPQDGARQLMSVFCRLQTEEGSVPAEDARYWPLAPLACREDVLFPDEPWPDERVSEAYARLLEGFAKGARELAACHTGDDANLAAYLEGLLLLMQRYTWCVPSAYSLARPDVSLYDHSRTTAALAACLQETPDARLDGLLGGPRNGDEPVALLIGGDISGVQEFIYTIIARRAASGLRGRSFYLQLLTEAIAWFVVRNLGLPSVNVIYQGGGGFYLLARAGDGATLDEIRRQISHVLLAHHRGDLYVALEAVPLVCADFYEGRISARWEELGGALQRAKQRRFAELDADTLAAVFSPQGDGGNEALQCQVCGREHPGTREHREEDQAEGEGVRKCPQCDSYEELGRALRQARYLWLEEGAPDVSPEPVGVVPGRWWRTLGDLGMRGGVVSEARDVPDDGAGRRLVLALKDGALASLRPDARTAVGRRFVVNATPTYGPGDEAWLDDQQDAVRERLRDDLPPDPVGRVKPFSILEAQSAGIPRLGVLRMDVDDLGRLFSEGFVVRDEDGREHRIATLSRVAALSSAVSLYFEGWVEVLAEKIGREPTYGFQRLYSIYSGGDDLFFVGAWNAVVEVSRQIRADLTRFAAGHPGVHASAGIALVGGKYPLYRAAMDAGEAEANAKALVWAGPDGRRLRKDAACFLGRSVPWRQFGLGACEQEGAGDAHVLAHRLVRMVRPEDAEGEGAPHAILRRLMRLQEMYEEAAEERRKQGRDINRTGQEQVYWGP